MTTENQPMDMEAMEGGVPAIKGREVDAEKDEAEEKELHAVLDTDGLTAIDAAKIKMIDDPKMQARVIALLQSGELHQPGRSRDGEAFNAFLEAEKRMRDMNRAKVKASDKGVKLPYTNA